MSDMEPKEMAGDGSTSVMKPAAAEGIAILGSHPATVEMAPFDSGWRIYACSPHNFEMRRLPRFDAWFEVHATLSDATRAYPYLKYLETLPLVWMRDKTAMPYIKGARPYPEEEMKAIFGAHPFTSSIAYMMAMAIVECEREGIDKLGLFGIMQASPNEYTYQRPGIQALIWEARKRDIDVYAPDISRLFEPPPEDF